MNCHIEYKSLKLKGHFQWIILLQVKVWFQNRRTKHKRMQQEEEAKTGQGGNKSNGSDSQTNSHHMNKWKQEAPDEYGEYIDMDMEDDCVSDVESES